MCLPIAAAAGTAAAFANTMTVVGTVVSVASTALGIYQAQEQANYQATAARQQADMQYRQAQLQVNNERQQQILRHIGDVNSQQAAALSYQKQLFNNSEASNRVYTAEQFKLSEARAKAAFKSQEILAKQIGATGRVLASGATGQSVGLLMTDAERQAGFATAQDNASLRSAALNSAFSMENAMSENASANNIAYSRVPMPVQAPLLAPDPVGVGTNLNLGVPTYTWG
jgi:disulfide bond formation protein DsbB